jgi:hypothetical protein
MIIGYDKNPEDEEGANDQLNLGGDSDDDDDSDSHPMVVPS